ncbi:hypothetical protein GMD78_12215 [Ornithinibacillus sp. L9]|uniref:Uncharacterized protein n=1 Tax=Ornithinibacillus caprae TaxID=2678566 RepID=A0A6N8FNY2_9BACI|nr:hypothetical protein [Ornithinibacillus caprae]MUK89138.1 hypothetical protein [Ornithinibacillus caprae]
MKKQSIKYKWKVDPYRKDKRTGAISPVKRSEYAESLFRVGAGFNGQQATGKLGGQADK